MGDQERTVIVRAGVLLADELGYEVFRVPREGFGAGTNPVLSRRSQLLHRSTLRLVSGSCRLGGRAGDDGDGPRGPRYTRSARGGFALGPGRQHPRRWTGRGSPREVQFRAPGRQKLSDTRDGGYSAFCWRLPAQIKPGPAASQLRPGSDTARPEVPIWSTRWARHGQTRGGRRSLVTDGFPRS